MNNNADNNRIFPKAPNPGPKSMDMRLGPTTFTPGPTLKGGGTSSPFTTAIEIFTPNFSLSPEESKQFLTFLRSKIADPQVSVPIILMASLFSIPPRIDDLMMVYAMAETESSLDPSAVNGTTFGLFQITKTNGDKWAKDFNTNSGLAPNISEFLQTHFPEVFEIWGHPITALLKNKTIPQDFRYSQYAPEISTLFSLLLMKYNISQMDKYALWDEKEKRWKPGPKLTNVTISKMLSSSGINYLYTKTYLYYLAWANGISKFGQPDAVFDHYDAALRTAEKAAALEESVSTPFAVSMSDIYDMLTS